jgi:hypothetical protein
MSQDVSKSEIPEKKCGFPVFRTTQRYSLFLENPRKKFPGKSDVFGGKFPEITNPENSEIPENFGKVQNVDFGKFNPRLQSVF